MEAKSYAWSGIEEDHPVPLLHRKKVVGQHILVARIRLEKGCVVKSHRHDSEQMAMVVSGRVRFGLGEEGTPEHRELEVSAGEILHLPSSCPHGVVALEDTEIVDMLSPVGPMGVDSHSK